MSPLAKGPLVIPFSEAQRSISGAGTIEAVRRFKRGERARYIHAAEEANAGGTADMRWREVFENLQRQFGGAVASVRCSLNDWNDKTGLGIVSVSMAPLDMRGKDCIFDNLEEDAKEPTDGLVAAIEQGEPRVIAGFGVERPELINRAGDRNLVAADSSMSTGLERPHEMGTGGLLMSPFRKATFTLGVTSSTQLASAQQLYNKSAFEIRYDESGKRPPVHAQRYVCRYLQETFAEKLRGVSAF